MYYTPTHMVLYFDRLLAFNSSFLFRLCLIRFARSESVFFFSLCSPLGICSEARPVTYFLIRRLFDTFRLYRPFLFRLNFVLLLFRTQTHTRSCGWRALLKQGTERNVTEYFVPFRDYSTELASVPFTVMQYLQS